MFNGKCVCRSRCAHPVTICSVARYYFSPTYFCAALLDTGGEDILTMVTGVARVRKTLSGARQNCYIEVLGHADHESGLNF